MPDLNSLPPSRPPSISQSRVYGSNQEPLPGQPGPSPRASSVSLAAAATINAGIQNQESRRSSTSSNRNRPPQPSQRRSSVAMNLSLNDPALPGPGELQTSDQSPSMTHAFRTSSPRSPRAPYSPSFPQPHHRTPSLGELHQELEQESEAQVNRLLEAIRQQQIQLQTAQQNAIYTPSTSTAAVDDSTPTSERSFSLPNVPGSLPMSVHNPRPRSPIPRGSFELSRRSSHRSRTPSRNTSPMLRPVSAGLQAQSEDWQLSSSGMLRGDSQSSRDEGAYYQAETQTLTRENQMLRMRIRELERQLQEGNSMFTNSPVTPSNLAASPIDGESDVQGHGVGLSETRDDKD
ncbi:hypothetical protein G7Y79_00038g074810 [Physcia stellaris]|nr:hypothetical protein G7Y79_00038g074810 [Physcia stellaris]